MMTIREYVAIAAMVAGLAPAAAAQDAVGQATPNPPARAELAIQPESRLWIEGTSTVRDYECQASSVDGAVELAGADASLAIPDLDASVRGAALAIQVAQLDCRNGTMNGHMRKALKAESNPAIRYRLTAHRIEVREDGSGAAVLDGELTIAGTTNPVTIDAVVTPGPDGALRLQGSKEIIMTEFGVSPPKLMLGTLKVNPRVMVHFDLVLKR